MGLLGLAHLTVEYVLPRLLVWAERAQGNGLFDPTLGGDPMLFRPHNRVLTFGALLLVLTGVAHVAAAVLYRRSTKRALTSLIVLGAVSLVPTSIAFAVLTLIALNRPTIRASGQDGSPSES